MIGEKEVKNIVVPVCIITGSGDSTFPDINEDFDIQKYTLPVFDNLLYAQWIALCNCITSAKESRDDFIVIAFDDFILTPKYSKKDLINYMLIANRHNCDILLGHIGRFNHAVPVTENLFWIDSFSHSLFIILFAGFYQKILETAPAIDETAIYTYLSYLTSNKLVVYPFIAKAKCAKSQEIKTIKFQESGDQLAVYQTIYQEYILKQ